jgi:hypothetical protein
MDRSANRLIARCVPWAGMGAAALAVLAGAFSTPAAAYRPFDGTDAAVADPGELEVEFQPAGRLHDDTASTLIAPAAVVNFGVAEGWEAVLEGQLQTPLLPDGATGFAAGGAFLKHVLRPGSLQDKAGPSIATEFGVLLPESNDPNSGYGASVAGIVSQRWDWGTIHFNMQTELTREHTGDVFVSAILEGPARWTVRPVAEIFYEKEFGRADTLSALGGLIWQIRDNLALDVGFREARRNGRPINEIRAGLTVWVPLFAMGRTERR